MIRSLASFTTAVTLALGLTACGDDKDDTTNVTTQTTPATSSPTSDPTGDPTTDPTGDPSGSTSGGMEGSTSDPNPTTGMTTGPTSDDTTGPGTSMTSTTTMTSTTDDTGSSGGSETTGGGGVPDPVYPACDMMGGCPMGADCVSVEGLDGNFCSPKCSDMMPCPDTVSGAAPMCVLVLMMGEPPSNCGLICNPMASGECPQGSSCKEIMGGGICTYP